MNDGYVILKNVVPPDQLQPLRDSVETLLDRQVAESVAQRKASEPPGGQWELQPNPTLIVSDFVDAETENVIEFMLHDNTLGLSKRLCTAEAAAPLILQVFCDPAHDHGPGAWHRDMKPNYLAPLCGLQDDLRANGPDFVQWNIALYEDATYCAVPGSHLRPNTDEENRLLADSTQADLPGSIPIELEPGDGVAGCNLILHRGGSYRPGWRRTIHPVYRVWGVDSFGRIPYYHWDLEFTKNLSPAIREQFSGFVDLQRQTTDLVVKLFQSIVAKDETGFRRDLAALHPGETGRFVCLIELSKLAFQILSVHRPDLVKRLTGERLVDFDIVDGVVKRSTAHLPAPPPNPAGDPQIDRIAESFSLEEADVLWERFATLDAALKTDGEQFVPGFQFGPSPYRFNEMPEEFGVDEFVASW
jgi:hypothetical protein